MYSTSSTTLVYRREALGRRSPQAEVFTFEPIPTETSDRHRHRPKKRCTRVMYPAKVRMHLPPPEKSAAKRCLLLLVLLLLWQIYTEEPCAADTPTAGPDDHRAGAGADNAAANAGAGASPSGVCEAQAPLDDCARNSYVVALLVYHRLGADN